MKKGIDMMTTEAADEIRYCDKLLEIIYHRWTREYCEVCDYAMPLVPGTRRCADCYNEYFS